MSDDKSKPEIPQYWEGFESYLLGGFKPLSVKTWEQLFINQWQPPAEIKLVMDMSPEEEQALIAKMKDFVATQFVLDQKQGEITVSQLSDKELNDRINAMVPDYSGNWVGAAERVFNFMNNLEPGVTWTLYDSFNEEDHQRLWTANLGQVTLSGMNFSRLIAETFLVWMTLNKVTIPSNPLELLNRREGTNHQGDTDQ